MTVTCRVLILALALLVLPGIAGAQTEDISSPGLRISWEAFRKLYDSGKVEVVDVRGADAFAEGHIPGARSVPLDEVGKRGEALRKLGKPIILYCA